jgi:hypothetical protein
MPQHRSRLNKLVFGVALLWLVASLLLLLYHPGPAAVQPHRARHPETRAHQRLALTASQATARASFM